MAPKKKQKMEPPAPPLSISRLTKHRVELPETLSPGALCSTRVAVAALPDPAASQYEAYLASGRQVYRLTAQRSAQGFQGERGKEGVYIPEAVAQGATVEALPLLSHRAEIQDLRLFEGGGSGSSSEPGGGGTAVLASADCYGRAVLAHCQRASPEGPLEVVGVSTLQPQDMLREAGWAGVAVAPGQPSQAAVARHFAKDVTLFDNGVAVRSLYTMYCPSAVQLLSTQLAADSIGGPLVAVAEGPQVSLWDVRGAGRGARVAKLSPGPQHGHLLCLAASDDGGTPLIGAAGMDRSVLVWDPRIWKLLDRWSNCSKYEVTDLHFCSGSPRHAVVGSQDYEVLCGEWGGNKGSRLGGGTRTGLEGGEDREGGASASRGVSFRGDSKWMGMAKAWRQNLLAGVTATSHLYLAELS